MHDILRLLVDKGIDITAKTTTSCTNSLIWICAYYKQEDLIDIIKLLIEKDSSVINCINKRSGRNALVTVCLQYSMGGTDNLVISIVKFLIGKGIDINNKSFSSWNALMAV